ncbi:hypothetical protein FOZ63_010108 [Perkinsus olseni]|uniref:Uncharacterized protein n=1 Tax=Perkinsus olseni TaxID=32597 RepID=A0A7J6TC28_PEROL|nr:hypothetical protein FOZ63_010108 [Perkinsus olseni]
MFGARRISDRKELILEPIDPNKFNGSRQGFKQARMPTIEGLLFDSSGLPGLLGLTKDSKFDVARSQMRRSFRAIRNMACRFRRQGKDGLMNKLLGENDTGKHGISTDDPNRVFAE